MSPETIIQETLGKTAKNVTLIGVFVLILGIIALVYPSNFGTVTTVIVGVFFIIAGIMRLSYSVFSLSMGSLFMRYFFAILMIIAGVWIIMNPHMGLEALTMVMGVYFIVDGITQFVYSFQLMPIGGGMYMLFNGLLGILLGVLIFSQWPESSYYVLGTYLGAKLLVDGIMLIATGVAVRKANKELQ